MDIPPPPPRHPSVAARIAHAAPAPKAAAAAGTPPTSSLPPPPSSRSSLLQPLQTSVGNSSGPTAITLEPPTPVTPARPQAVASTSDNIQILDDAHQQTVSPATSTASSDTSDLESDSESDSEPEDDPTDDRTQEAVLRRVASEIIQQSPTDEPEGWSSGIGGWSGLRRRVTLRQTTETPFRNGQDSSPPPKPLSPQEEELRLALEELEDVEVATFLSRASKRMSQVNILPQPVAPVYPERANFTTDGKTDWVAFGIAYAMTLAEVYCPPALLAPPRREDLSIKFLRGELERLYIIAPPARVNDILTEELSAIWRWESPATWKWLALYSTLWLLDLIPMLPFAYLAYRILRVRMYPPDAQELLTESSIRALRTEQAAKLSKQLKATHASGYAGMALAGAKGLVSQIRKRAGSSATIGTRGALASALEASATVGGLGGVRLPGRDGAPLRQDSASSSQEGEGGSKKDVDADDSEDVSLFQVLRDMARTAGPSGQDLLEQTADLGEKIKNVILHPEHPSVPMVLVRLGALCLILVVTPAWFQLKVFWLYLGIEFFALWKLRELFPRYRRALTPVWWIFLGAPTDSQLAAFIMRKRHLQQKPILGRKTLKRKAHKFQRLESLPNDSSSSLGVLGTRSRSSSIASGDSKFPSRSSTLEEVTNPVLASHFALHMAVPGELVVTAEHVKFVAMRQLRTIAPGLHKMARKWDKYQKRRDRGKQAEEPGSDAARLARTRTLKVKDGYEVKIKILDLVGVRKDRSKLDLLEGITVTDKRGKEWKFTNVSRRDEAFNRIVSLTPSTLKAS
ncbi:hypothetical protein OIV83_005801 [Microbotryomycetes sp. JL201]|nr:hypothetical protein OIV83_005801 [Microbotryomycetes sp. JL201]